MPFWLRWPTNNPGIDQPFGVNWTGDPDFYKAYGLPGHEGIDFTAADGSEVFACADGEVKRISPDGNTDVKNKPYGNQLRITHRTAEGEFETTYAHLKEFRQGLTVGDLVHAGDLIGLADNTGHTTGTHLHVTLKKKGASAAGETNFPRDIMDPTPYLIPLAAAVPADGLSAPPLPQAFNNRYRLQTDEAQFGRAWAWASGGSGNQRWLNLIATSNAPYSNAAQRQALNDPSCVENAIQYLNPQASPKGRPRYRSTPQSTFCNIFVNDATRVLHCEIPNNPANTTVAQMLGWLEANGGAAGWTNTVSGQEAQDSVNNGRVAVMIWSHKKPLDHVALVRPGQGNARNGFFWPRVAQAGAAVSADLDSFVSFGILRTELIGFFLHD